MRQILQHLLTEQSFAFTAYDIVDSTQACTAVRRFLSSLWRYAILSVALMNTWMWFVEAKGCKNFVVVMPSKPASQTVISKRTTTHCHAWAGTAYCGSVNSFPSASNVISIRSHRVLYVRITISLWLSLSKLIKCIWPFHSKQDEQ